MKRTVFFALALTLALFVSACGSDDALSRLNGAWAIDLPATINANPDMKNSIPEGETGDMARQMLEKMLGDMKLTFDTKAGTMSGSLMGNTLDAQKFQDATVKGDAVEMTMDGQKVTFTVKGDEMLLKDASGATVIFKRAK